VPDWIDISVPLRTGMVHWPGDPPVNFKRVKALEDGDTSNLTKIEMGAHTGTHIDAPFHFLPNTATIDQMPLDVTVGPARVIQIEDSKSIQVDELKQHNIQARERLLFKTQNSDRCWKSDTFVEDFVYLSLEAASFLAHSKVKLVGVDYLSVGGFKTDGAVIHKALLQQGVWILEGLNLSKVLPGPYELVCLPLKIVSGDGAPARAILKDRF